MVYGPLVMIWPCLEVLECNIRLLQTRVSENGHDLVSLCHSKGAAGLWQVLAGGEDFDQILACREAYEPLTIVFVTPRACLHAMSDSHDLKWTKTGTMRLRCVTGPKAQRGHGTWTTCKIAHGLIMMVLVVFLAS